MRDVLAAEGGRVQLIDGAQPDSGWTTIVGEGKSRFGRGVSLANQVRSYNDSYRALKHVRTIKVVFLFTGGVMSRVAEFGYHWCTSHQCPRIRGTAQIGWSCSLL